MGMKSRRKRERRAERGPLMILDEAVTQTDRELLRAFLVRTHWPEK